MSCKEKLPKLVDVYRPSNKLTRRQLPLAVDENLTLVMDVKGSGIVCDSPSVRGKELDQFIRKWTMLSETELNSALRIDKNELMHVLNQNVPCVGCRRSVERLYLQLLKCGHLTLDPLVVNPDGIITIRDEQQGNPQILCSIFHEHMIRLAKLIENQPKKNKKSPRCLLHSLESQRSRPLTPVWRDVWDCMKPECKKNVCIIEAISLHNTLETYLRKHRFCGECRTKVLKAYSLLVEEREPGKEKGFVSSLYGGIKRCFEDKHIHLQTKTDYITKLISRAEPELLGSRRERHAKTLEIAQEEVLTCLGICMYERLHRIYMRMREEECTCQVFAAVAVDTLSRSFEMAVERKQGISQLELLYAELTREEQQRQIRKEQKKIKRKRKKGKLGDLDEKENLQNDDEDCEEEEDDRDNLDKECHCSEKNSSLNCYNCEHLSSLNNLNGSYEVCSRGQKDKLLCTNNDDWPDDCKCENGKENGESDFKCDRYLSGMFKKENGLHNEHSHDCGYSSENNNNGCCETGSLSSSVSSSPEGSELACSDTCCNHENDCISYCSRLFYRGNGQLSLQEMLEDHSDEEDSNCYITPEEVIEFKTNNRQVYEKRQELRETLQKRFALFCVNGPLEVPRLLIQTKYASN